MVGPGVNWLPTGILLLATGSVLRGILLLAFGVLVISTVDNVIRSFLVGARARIHPLAIFLGVLGGILLFGAVGVFVGPVLLVVSLLLLEMVRLSLFPGGTAVTPYAEPEPGAGPAPVTGEPLRTPR
jgi:predicted PurR-regulated permease PerM